MSPCTQEDFENALQKPGGMVASHGDIIEFTQTVTHLEKDGYVTHTMLVWQDEVNYFVSRESA